MLHDGDNLRLRGAARDLSTYAEGRGTILAEGSIEVELDGDRTLASITTSPSVPGSESLVGRHVGRGFRAAAAALLPAELVAQPVSLLLDDLPVAAIISGYSRLYGSGDGLSSGAAPGIKADICAGWQADGSLMTSIRDGSGMQMIETIAPRIEDPEDELSWHEMPELARGVMRRRRIVDLSVGEGVALWAWFRDTHGAPDGGKTVLHEYEVEGRIEEKYGPLSACVATPRVLPFPDCPAAAASAGRLVGRPLSDISQRVRSEFRGITTCTHLNDLFSSVGAVESLLA